MEAVDFLGGKYQRANQILSGTITTFRAFDPSTSRDVFVHRVASSDPAAQQLALLLSSALIRSAKARRLILDVVEQDGYAHIVTDTEHQCLLLREWLQFEINQAGGSVPSASPGPTAQAPAQPQPSAAPAPSQPATPNPQPKQEPGEFTRMFMASMSTPVTPPSPARAGDETLPAVPVAEKPTDPKMEGPKAEPPKPEPAKSEPGEFTRMFMAATAAVEKEAKPASTQAPSAQPPTQAPASPPKQEPGEFTRFFQSPGPIDSKPAPPPVSRTSERPSNPGSVQRPAGTSAAPPISSVPSAPPSAPPPVAKKTEPGEFTRMFMQTPSAPPSPRPSAPADSLPDPFANPAGAGMFGQSPASAVPPPQEKPMGEYTRIFGSGSQAPPPQQQSTVAPPKPVVSDDPLARTPQYAAPVPNPPAPSQAGPSEYTLVMSGGRPADGSVGRAAPNPPAPGGASAPAIPVPQIQVNVAPPNVMQGLKVPPPPAASAGIGGVSASAQGPKMPTAPAPPKMNFQTPPAVKPPAGVPAVAPNKNKLVIFFVILGLLAIALVILIVLLLKK